MNRNNIIVLILIVGFLGVIGFAIGTNIGKSEKKQKTSSPASASVKTSTSSESGYSLLASKIPGTWEWDAGDLGKVRIALYEDGAGSWQFPNAKITLEATRDGFAATATWSERGEERTYDFTGEIMGNGDLLRVHDFGRSGFAPRQHTTFKRVEQ